ncbi:unnamed protein product [Euphydryas editha]|uniref:Uncharacterized protein n=1 Tax=Euphydryas editha TaxID=104508 RepID=A0AAU9U8D1_EUPED|nr:unnamed protein product [Euphydryas editha]
MVEVFLKVIIDDLTSTIAFGRFTTKVKRLSFNSSLEDCKSSYKGFRSILNIMKIIRISIGPESHGFVVRRDESRIECSEFRVSRASKEVKIAHLAEINSLNIQFEVEVQMYGAGIVD